MGQTLYSASWSRCIEWSRTGTGRTRSRTDGKFGCRTKEIVRMQGLFAYFSKNLKGKKGQSGFTLIELLVVVTILGVLAAIVTLSLVGITTNAEKQSCLQEYKTVQSGLDADMPYSELTTLT